MIRAGCSPMRLHPGAIGHVCLDRLLVHLVGN